MELTKNTLIVAIRGYSLLATNDPDPKPESMGVMLYNENKVSPEMPIAAFVRMGYWDGIFPPRSITEEELKQFTTATAG